MRGDRPRIIGHRSCGREDRAIMPSRFTGKRIIEFPWLHSAGRGLPTGAGGTALLVSSAPWPEMIMAGLPHRTVIDAAGTSLGTSLLIRKQTHWPAP